MYSVQERAAESPSIEVAVERDDDHCPECGRAWHAALTEANPKPGPFPWSSWLMIALAIYLVVAFGPRAWIAIHIPAGQAILPTAACLTAGTEQDDVDCNPTLARAGATVGLVWLAIGLAVIAHTRFLNVKRQTRWSSPALVASLSGNSLVDLVLKLCASVEETGRSLFQLQVLLVSYVGVIRLLEGAPPSWQLIGRAIDRGIALIVAVQQSL